MCRILFLNYEHAVKINAKGCNSFFSLHRIITHNSNCISNLIIWIFLNCSVVRTYKIHTHIHICIDQLCGTKKMRRRQRTTWMGISRGNWGLAHILTIHTHLYFYRFVLNQMRSVRNKSSKKQMSIFLILDFVGFFIGPFGQKKKI